MSAPKMRDQKSLTRIVADVTAAYVAHNKCAVEQIDELIVSIHKSLSQITTLHGDQPPSNRPSISIKKSVTPDYLVCLEDGRKLKTLKRHLANAFGLTPDAYRAKWRLPSDYPMTAPNYSLRRSRLAKKFGLGRKG